MYLEQLYEKYNIKKQWLTLISRGNRSNTLNRNTGTMYNISRGSNDNTSSQKCHLNT